MPKKNQPPQVYKTESQLKEEAAKKHAAEAKASAAVPKSELQKKRENFWYHYKWHTIGGAFAVFLFAFFVKDMFFRTMPDITVVVVSESVFSEQETTALTDYIGSFATDFNGDNKTEVATDCITLPAFGNVPQQNSAVMPDLTGGEQEMANAMKLMAVLSAGTDPVYLLDEAAYAYIAEMGKDEDGNEGDVVFEEFSVPLDREKLGLDSAYVFDGMRFYLRPTNKDEAYYDYCKQLLEAIDRD